MDKIYQYENNGKCQIFFQKPKRIKARTTSFLGSIKRWCSSALGKVDVALVDPIEALVDKREGGDSR